MDPGRRKELIAALVDAAREYSTAAVLLHATVGERFGLSASDLKALDILQRRGPATAGELGRETGLASASVTSLIDRLAAKKLVRRVRDGADRRRVFVTLTPRMERTVAPLFASLHRRMLARSRAHRPRELALIAEFLRGSARDMRASASGRAVAAAADRGATTFR